MPGTASETDGEKLARLGTDAALWAHELVEAVRTMAAREAADPGPSGPMSAEDIILCDSPGEVLHVWMVGAIEAGRSAGYAAGRHDAAEDARRLALGLTAQAARYVTPGQTLAAAEAIRRQLTGWPLPADSAASDLPANLAASDLEANLAGSSYEEVLAAVGTGNEQLARMAEALERLAACVHPAHPSLRTTSLR